LLETRISSLNQGLQVVSSEKLINAEEVKAEEETIRGARAVNQANGLNLTNLAGSSFSPGEEVSLEINRLDGSSLSYAILLTEGLKLVDRVGPFGFKFSAPKEPGVYKIEVFAFDESGTSFSAFTNLIVR